MRDDIFFARTYELGTPSIFADAAAWSMIIFLSVAFFRRCIFDSIRGIFFFITRQDRHFRYEMQRIGGTGKNKRKEKSYSVETSMQRDDCNGMFHKRAATQTIMNTMKSFKYIKQASILNELRGISD